ncbi:hypothetical protein KA005_85620 [bacterium]|nr:hypothetical protein [bacterium]
MIAPVYTVLYIGMKKIAEKYGYALTLHGSMNRDLDLLAVPWTKEAEDLEVLLEAFRKKYDMRYEMDKPNYGNVMDKPHGRKAYIIMLNGPYYIDLSIMPLEVTS